jgi:hypothetical protein
MPPKKKDTGPVKPGTEVGDSNKPMTAKDLAANYQWSMALLNSDPELRKLFRQAVKQGWQSGRFIAELQDTKWFKTHRESWRKNEIQKIVDPASWNAARKANRATVEDMASQMGAVLSGPQMQDFADKAMSLGWNPNQIKNQLGVYIRTQKAGPNEGMFTGAAGEAFTQIKAAALRNGYTIPKGKANQWVAEIAVGNSTVEDYAQMMRESAARAFPSLHNELIAGADLEELAAPYRNKMAELLELDPREIALDDKTLVKGLSVKDEKNKWTTMPLYDFQEQLKKDDRWQYTDNAKSEIMGEVLKLGRAFGKTG